VGAFNPASKASGGGGIASPLIEEDANLREYWPGGTLSSYGLFQMLNLKRLVLTDAAGATVYFDFPDPEAPAVAG
jgi:hypothetical protein